jgi:hypothetical protein
MIRMWRIVEPLFPIRDAAPMSATGFAGIALEAAILNYVIGHADPFVIDQHVDAGGSDPVMRRMAILGHHSWVIAQVNASDGSASRPWSFPECVTPRKQELS